jgi:4-hydroxy-tetrahydrodipicolinate synthase
MAHPPYSGTYTALVTPFLNGKVDEAGLQRLVEAQMADGIDGIVAVGTTGESPTLDHEEHLKVIERVVQFAKGRTRVIAGTGSNSTREAIELSVASEKLGAHALLLVAPYYNKPSQAGLVGHFGEIARATSLPIILYSIPGRCGIEIGIETTATLASAHPNIIGIKESGGTVERVSALRQVLPDSFTILSGDDSMTVPFMSVGAAGVISVASNLIPAEVVSLVSAALKGDYVRAEALHRRYYPLFKDLFIEPNPVPVKMALARRGLIASDVRPPLVAMDEKLRSRLENTLAALGL